MIETFKHRIQPAILELHETVMAQMSDCPLPEALGEHLNHLRGDGTGRSIVLLAVMNDVLRMNQIALGPNPETHPEALDAILPLCRSAAKTFAAKGLAHYEPYTNLQREDASEFLEFYRSSRLPFTAEASVTQWSGLQICRNVAVHTQDGSVVDAYEELINTVTDFWDEVGLTRRQSPAIAALQEFLTDSCEDIRDELGDHSHERPRISSNVDRHLEAERNRLSQWQEQLNRQHAELSAGRSELQKQLTDLRDRETRLKQLQAQLKQQQDQFADRETQLQAARERLTIDQSALEMQRQKIEQLRAQLETEKDSSKNRSLESERSALWKDREELALERDRLAAERIRLEQERDAFEHERFQHQQPDSAEQASISADDNDPASEPSDFLVDDLDDHDFVSELMAASQIGDVLTIHAILARLPHSVSEQLVWGNRETNNAVLAATVGHDDEKYDTIARLLAESCPSCVRSAFPSLLQILRDASSPPSARRRSAQAIGSLQQDANHAIPILLGVLESEDRSVALAASEAIAKIDPSAIETEAIPYLNSILDHAQSSSQSRTWTANLYAARADLHRLSNQPQPALEDYQESLRHRTSPNHPDQQFCTELEAYLKNSSASPNPSPRT